ncbi:hypothetical protein HETIRDRAFT_436697 [Heterobasidion irregulare TC 32-1]|uniref:Uncharacterized protein n=1 Tax=Heterobasidion irregulare (strain TC 32-1) TaxID=747525 RepID=W4JRX4_HETIT|nr:uncharacterized protein HETIRDRAFT_436697 [Heterobasidion irregulare TC 32-1]ETW75636.1 hypothetical protein HETIRDRAFT_436697 [Heterobasidion irregulare TC 32-1]
MCKDRRIDKVDSGRGRGVEGGGPGWQAYMESKGRPCVGRAEGPVCRGRLAQGETTTYLHDARPSREMLEGTVCRHSRK